MSPSPRGAAPAGDFNQGTESAFARAVSAEIRGRMAAERITGRQMAEMTGLSHTYLAKRLRDVLPFTLDDLDRIFRVWDEDGPEFIQTAFNNHWERIAFDSDLTREASAKRQQQRDYDLAAHEEETSIEDEQGHDEHP